MSYTLKDLKLDEVAEIEKQLNERGTIVTLEDLRIATRTYEKET